MKTGLSEQFRSSDLRVVVAIVALLLLALARPSLAQDIYVYPAKGQSQEQQDRDRYECHSWAVKQTGFDPSRPQTALSLKGTQYLTSYRSSGARCHRRRTRAALGAVMRSRASTTLTSHYGGVPDRT